MGAEIVALGGLFGITGVFALIGTLFAGWMAWRIVEKAGLPGWTGLGAILLTLTAVGTIVPLILLWVFAYMRWPRDEPASPVGMGAGAPGPGPTGSPGASQPGVLPPPPLALADTRGWRLEGRLGDGSALALPIGTGPSYLVTGATPAAANEIAIADPSIGRPHARLLVSGRRLGLEDLGSPGGTLIDGARLLPEHGPRDISAARTIRLGTVELALVRV